MVQAGVVMGRNPRNASQKTVSISSRSAPCLRPSANLLGAQRRRAPARQQAPVIAACLHRRDENAGLSPPSALVRPESPVAVDAALAAPLEPRPDLVRGRLDNGFEYVIVPNKTPPGRFEAHLQMHVGSVDERDDEQGISHIVEHITFLGSRRREALIGTGARSNAYTDFHHTVFHVHSPMTSTQYGAPMLKQVIEALTEVAFYPEFLRNRIEKERKAVLAEAQMMNTIEYRIDCQLLRYLHQENAIGCRFPIGLVDQIKSWKKEQMYDYWKRWYFPGNATLYVVGDFGSPEEIQRCQAIIQESFGAVPPGLSPEDGSRRERHPVRPPVVHVHGCGPLRPNEVTPMEVSTFQHPLVSNFNLSVFAKLPTHSMNALRHVKEVLIHRILVSVYQRRIGRSYNEGEASFHSIELDISDSGREGCCVCTLTVTSEPKDWAGAVRVAVREAKRMQQHGITQGELDRYLEALLNDGSQLARSCDSQPHSEVLDFVMECITNKHVVNDNVQSFETMLQAAQYITLDEVRTMARSVLCFIARYGQEAEALADYEAQPELYYEPGPVRPTCIVACIPSFIDASGESRAGGAMPRMAATTTMGHLDGSEINIDEVKQPGEDEGEFLPPPGSIAFDWKEEELQAVMAADYEVEPLDDITVPDSFVSDEYIEERMARLQPRFVPVLNRESEGPMPPPEASSGVVQRRLSNGVTLNYKVSNNDPGSASLRLCASGGRAVEPTSGAGPAGVGAVQVGVRCISEAGTVADFKREEVEMFCLSRLINCLMDTDAENSFIDFHFISNAEGISAVFQLLHLMAERPLWDERAFHRAKVGCESTFRAVPKSLERNSLDRIMQMVFGNDRRFREANSEELAALTLDGVRQATERLMRPDNFEVSIVGDFNPADLERTFLRLMGTIEPKPGPWPLPLVPITFNREISLAERHQVWHLQDSDERANGYIAGIAFRRWGPLDSTAPVTARPGPVLPPPEVTAGSPTELALAQTLRRNHPLFATTVLLMLLEVINARLFVTVRDQLNLTYDVSFELNQFDRLNAAWFCVSVTATPAKISEATQASLQVLRDLKVNKIAQSEVDRSKSTLLTRHEADMKDNNYMLNLITHLQAPDVPLKTVECLRDLPTMMRVITLADLNDAYAQFGLNDNEIYTVIGTSGPREPDVPPKLMMQADGGEQLFAASRGDAPGATDLLMAALAEGLKQQLKLMGGVNNDNNKPSQS